MMMTARMTMMETEKKTSDEFTDPRLHNRSIPGRLWEKKERLPGTSIQNSAIRRCGREPHRPGGIASSPGPVAGPSRRY